MVDRIFGFEPVRRSDARLLILGSMPSVESLNQNFYYSHPRNAFWPIMAQILGEDIPVSIDDKKTMLTKHGIALWDTVYSCQRQGSLDSAIRSAESNDFEKLYEECPGIRHIFFNGAAAQQLYCKLVAKRDARFEFRRLPSTSPAYTLKYELKLEAWRQAIEEVLNNESP